MTRLSSITVRRYGTGPGPVVLLHGGPGAPGYLAPVARRLEDAFSVHEPLQRLGGEVPLTVAQHVADLAAVLEPPAVLVGHSWGAMLALSFAAAHPGTVRGVVLVGCGTYDAASRATYHRIMRERVGDRLVAGDPDFKERARVATRAQAYDPVPRPDEVVAYDPEGHRETWDDALRLQAERIEPAAFSAITAPVWMVHGDHDPHPGHATFETLRAHIPHLEYTELERCGHEPWNERHAREPFARLLRERLRAWLVPEI